jgi:hypothetical protein
LRAKAILDQLSHGDECFVDTDRRVRPGYGDGVLQNIDLHAVASHPPVCISTRIAPELAAEGQISVRHAAAPPD